MIVKRLQMPSRRECLKLAGIGLGSWLLGGCARSPSPAETPSEMLMRFPEKVPLLVLNDRPPCLETPWEYFQHDLTPNEAFYVRWHLQMIPTEIDLRTWRLRVGGQVERSLELSMDELRNMPSASIVAVNQCSGNSRSLFEPRLPGAQWVNGAMGNARWTGVPLTELLSRAGVRAGAVDVSFAGLDRGGINTIPDFVKSLSLADAQQPDVLVAYEMNGASLPMLNGYPVRLVVPGWFGTYWVKALSQITVLDAPFTGFWMRSAYRIPTTNNGLEMPGQLAGQTVPISRMRIRSFVVKPANNEEIPRGQPYPVEGIAFDDGNGIRSVQFSSDGGATWQETTLGIDLGRYSFRRWRIQWQATQPGEYRLQVRASNSDGTQPAIAGWNRAGYLRNVIEEIRVRVV
jgi:sulfite dehydrogenase (cytochrome) subunit A